MTYEVSWLRTLLYSATQPFAGLRAEMFSCQDQRSRARLFLICSRRVSYCEDLSTMVENLKSGRTLEQAYRDLSDPIQVAEADKFESGRPPIMGFLLGAAPSPHENAHQAYWRIRRPLEAALLERLRSGELYATGFEVPISPSSTRELVNPELWHVLVPDYDNSAAEGAGLTVVNLLIFERDEVQHHDMGPKSRKSTFTANRDYSVVRLGDVEFQLGILQAAVVRELHNAAMRSDPWQSGKALLSDIGAKTRSIGDLFRRHQDPSWRLLIEEYRGRYRLRLRHPATTCVAA